MRSACVSLYSIDDNSALDDDDERVVPHEEVNMVVAQLKRITRSASLEFALRVGAVIIHHFYEGDTSCWRSRGPKTTSFRRLAQHPELPLSAGSLYRCVALFELCERLKAPSRWEYLGASHLRMVLGLAPDAQERLLAVANESRWTVKTLQSAVASEKTARIARGGRRAQALVSKSLRTVRKCLDDHMGVLAQLENFSGGEVEQSIRLIEETRLCLENLSQSLLEALSRREVGSSSNAANAVRDAEVLAPRSLPASLAASGRRQGHNAKGPVHRSE
jgi:hypothetical protein